MSQRYRGGFITANPPAPTSTTATGIWTSSQQMQAKSASNWPAAPSYWIGKLNFINDSIANDASGNVYTCGNNSSQIQVIKYNYEGTIQWQRALSGGTSGGRSVAVDSSGNVYVCGFSDAPGFSVLQIAKYNSSGALQWQRRLGSSVGASGYSIAVDGSGNAYVCGISMLSGLATYQIAKYNTSGVIQWQRRLYAGGQENEGYSIAVDSSGNSYIAGRTGGSGVWQAQIAKYDTSGTIQWQRKLDGSGTDYAYGITTDSSGNVYMCGYSDTVDPAGEGIVAKYDTSGTIQWQRRFGNGVSLVDANDISVDGSGNVYVVGRASGSGGYGIQIVKYNGSGTLQWQRMLDSSNSDQGRIISVDANGNMYFCGSQLLAKLPSDGSRTGSYTVGGTAVTYSATSLNSNNGGLTDSATSLTDAATTLTEAASTLTDTATSLTISLTNV